MGDNSASSSGSPDTAAPNTAHHSEQEINVLITGFGPFKAQYPINPSWEIARSLPSTLHLPPSARSPGGTKVNLRVHPRAIRVAYAVVDAVVPGLWEGEDNWRPDWGVHIGMAAGREFYSLEKRAAGWGYTVGDVEGCLPDKAGVGGEVLEPGIGVEDVVGVWKGMVGGADVRASEDAGRYLCEYILHGSLGFLRGEEREGKCLFLHVPAGVAEADVERGRRVVLGLVEAVVEVGWEGGEGEQGGEGEKVVVKGFVGGGSVRERVGL
ncbi:hypothetical protein VE03_08812 [Pseudogymnoascus sp. 23342-1-I1]|nr:hypothetical protein VE03_08812 [Pseudogymnoascus sp. 23342-1-I1]